MQPSCRDCWAIAHALIFSPYIVHIGYCLSIVSSVTILVLPLHDIASSWVNQRQHSLRRIWVFKYCFCIALPFFPLSATTFSWINQWNGIDLEWMGTFQRGWILFVWYDSIEQDIMLPITKGTDPHIIINSINATKAIIDNILRETLLPIICHPAVDVFQ